MNRDGQRSTINLCIISVTRVHPCPSVSIQTGRANPRRLLSRLDHGSRLKAGMTGSPAGSSREPPTLDRRIPLTTDRGVTSALSRGPSRGRAGAVPASVGEAEKWVCLTGMNRDNRSRISLFYISYPCPSLSMQSGGLKIGRLSGGLIHGSRLKAGMTGRPIGSSRERPRLDRRTPSTTDRGVTPASSRGLSRRRTGAVPASVGGAERWVCLTGMNRDNVNKPRRYGFCYPCSSLSNQTGRATACRFPSGLDLGSRLKAGMTGRLAGSSRERPRLKRRSPMTANRAVTPALSRGPSRGRTAAVWTGVGHGARPRPRR